MSRAALFEIGASVLFFKTNYPENTHLVPTLNFSQQVCWTLSDMLFPSDFSGLIYKMM